MQTRKNVQKIEVLKPTAAMLNNRKGNLALVIPILALAGLGFLGYGAYNHYFGDDNVKAGELGVVQTQVTNPDGSISTVERDTDSQILCGANKDTAMNFVTVNPLDEDGTPSYPAVALKIIKESGAGALSTYTTDTDGTFASASLSQNCGESYVVYSPASINATASGKWDYTTSQPNDNLLLEVDQLDHISVKAYDNVNHGAVYSIHDTSYEDMATASVTFKSSADNSTAYAMATGGELDMSFTMKTATQRTWGDLKNYIALDADKTDFASTPVVMFEGQALTEIGKGALDPEDAGYLSSYEYVYALPYDIGESTSELRVKVQAKSSIDPDVDIVIRPIAESYWVDGTQVKKSIFKNDGTEVLMTARTITVDIS
ncbi:hypothetical protein ACFL43_04155 [Thermodesulfobacteriota bacterium]